MIPCTSRTVPESWKFQEMSTPKLHDRLVCSTRLTLAVLAFFGCAVMYSLRVNLSMAIVCMVNRTRDAASDENSTKSNECGHSVLTNATTPLMPIKVGEFDWDSDVEGSVLGAFFWGYLFTQILGGWAAQRFGAKNVMTINVFVSVLVTLLTPTAARLHYSFLISLRVMMGLVQGSMFPGFVVLWTRWAPPLERSKLTSFTFAGMQIGNVISLPLAGYLCQHGFDGGWPSIFYTAGIASVVWAAAWMLLASDTPENHKTISENEKLYISTCLDNRSSQPTNESIVDVPWVQIMKSVPVWACFAAHFAGDWGGYLMLTCLPLFLNQVLRFDVTKLGFVAAIPYVASLIGMNLGGVLADWLIKRQFMTALSVRRMFTFVSLGTQAVCLVGAAYCQCGQEILAIVLLTIGGGIASMQMSGSLINYMEIAPRYAGLIVGIGNTISCIAGILGPSVMSAMTPNHTRNEWLSLFYLTAAILIIGAVVFCVFSNGDVQPWAIRGRKRPWGSIVGECPETEKLNQECIG